MNKFAEQVHAAFASFPNCHQSVGTFVQHIMKDMEKIGERIDQQPPQEDQQQQEEEEAADGDVVVVVVCDQLFGVDGVNAAEDEHQEAADEQHDPFGHASAFDAFFNSSEDAKCCS